MRHYNRHSAFRRRNRILPGYKGHTTYDYAEFVPDKPPNPEAPYGKIFKREEWGALPAKGVDGHLIHPVMYINTLFLMVETEEGRLVEGLKGPEVVRMFQRRDMADGMVDIRANFIIDEDGLIYEGRGWKYKPGLLDKNHPNRNLGHMEICFIGDHSEARFNDPVNYATAKMMDMGMRKRFISREAFLITPKRLIYEHHPIPKTPELLTAF